MSPKLTWIYNVVHTHDRNKFREQIIDLAEQGFEVQEISTCCVPGPSAAVSNGFGMGGPAASVEVFFTALMRKKPEGPQIDEGPDPTGGTPAAAKVIPFRQLIAKAA